MLQSKLFYRSIKETKDGELSSYSFLVRAGFVDQLMSGVYTFLPLGLRVLKKIENIVREEMIKIGGQELLMPALNPKENWEKTGRWENFTALLKLETPDGKELALAPTHEEALSPLAKKIILSYKDLPSYVFQIQTKFRNEPRAKSGLLRTREFLMKDLYSFHASQDDLDEYYEKAAAAYLEIYRRCGIRDDSAENKITYQTLASGGTFSKYSDEFQTLTPAGEDIINICQKCGIGINQELAEETKEKCSNCGSKADYKKEKAVEVGNIFKLGTKYSEPFEFVFRNKDGDEKPVIMGCYGIGISRLMGTVAEIHHDDKGLIWPESVAPFKAHLLVLDQESMGKAEEIYEKLQENDVEILYDDREDKTPGEKFAEADLIGIPKRIVISKKTLAKESVELKNRDSREVNLIEVDDLIGKMS